MARVLVTGGTGFIGSHTVELLLQQGHHVICTIRPSRKDRGWLYSLPVEWIATDLSDVRPLVRLLEDVEYIFHIAGLTKAKSRSEYFRGNVGTTDTLLRAATELGTIKKFTLLSSLTVAGPSPSGIPLDESAPYNPITSYGESKVAAEKLVHQYAEKLPTLILRPPAVYGPRDRDILEMFKWIDRGIVPLLGKEERTLSLIHGVDLARGIIEASFAEHTAGNTYFISEETIHRYNDLVETICSIMNKRAIKLRFPAPAVWTLAVLSELAYLPVAKTPVLNREKVKDLLQPHWVCTPAKIKQDIGFQTRIPTNDGLVQTYLWYKEHGWL